MAINSLYFKLFQNGKEFEQILFLDNFYENISIDQETEQDLAKLLTIAINDSKSTYIKRSAFKIQCELTFLGKITNRFSTFCILQNFLWGNDSTLQAIALKYLPFFAELRTDLTSEKIIELSDNYDGELASQAFFCLGLVQLTNTILQTNITECVITLEKAKHYFYAALQVTENRIDAEFYILFIEWSEAVLSNDEKLSKAKFIELEKNLLFRNLYELTQTGLELDFLIFHLTEQIKTSFEIANKSKHWLEIPSQIQAVFNISLEIRKLKDASPNPFFTERIFSNIFVNLEISIYQVNLLSERGHLLSLQTLSEDLRLKKFIEQMISLFPTNSNPYSENPELLALLAENLGSESGLEQYKQINNKSISKEVMDALRELLRKNQNNQLPFRTGSIIGQEVFYSLRNQIIKLLPNYSRNKCETFFKIMEEVIRYARITFVGNEKKRFNFLFAESEGGKGQKAVEQDIQDSMFIFFEHSNIADGLDHEKAKFVDGGRVDILYKKDLITIPIELKKSKDRPDQNSLEQNYIAQAQTYTAGYDQLGIFVLLELSDKSTESPPNFKDWFKVHHLKASSNLPVKYPDYVISVVIPGNRTTPSSKSTYK
jgi:hypothetical protein